MNVSFTQWIKNVFIFVIYICICNDFINKWSLSCKPQYPWLRIVIWWIMSIHSKKKEGNFTQIYIGSFGMASSYKHS